MRFSASCIGCQLAGFPIPIRRSVRAGEHHRVTIGIAEPDFPMVRAAVAVGRITMAWHDDLGVQVLSACHRRVEVAEFEPQQHAVSVWGDIGISEAPMMMLHIPSVQLKDQPAVRDEPLIFGPAVGALAAKETLIPAAARLDIGHADQWLWIHTNLVATRFTSCSPLVANRRVDAPTAPSKTQTRFEPRPQAITRGHFYVGKKGDISISP